MEKYTKTDNYDISDLVPKEGETSSSTISLLPFGEPRLIGCVMSMDPVTGGEDQGGLEAIEDIGGKAKVYVKRAKDGDKAEEGKKRFLEELMKYDLLREESKEEVVYWDGLSREDMGVIFFFLIHTSGSIWFFPKVCITFNFWTTILYVMVNLMVASMGLIHVVDIAMDWIFRPTQKVHITYVPDEKLFQKAMKECAKVTKLSSIPTKSDLLYLYRMGVNRGDYVIKEVLEHFLMGKKMRSASGVIVVSVIMPPGNFSCSYDCAYCPNDPRYSRSYYHGEPTVMRGARNGFSGFMQFRERIHSYVVNGHPVDKIECIVLGGTFSCYKPADAEDFICDLYYAANTAFDDASCDQSAGYIPPRGGSQGGSPRESARQMNPKGVHSAHHPQRGDLSARTDPTTLRARLGLEEEQKLNETATCRMIGLTIETRPDMITRYELRRFRRLGVTRVQMGAQHTDNEILKGIDRRSTVEDTKHALRLLKDECFKVDLHWMPDLPRSSLEKDREMFVEALTNPDLSADQWKIYPTNVLPYTKIKEWYDAGTYKPYTERDYEGFLEMIMYVLNSMPPYVRVNRIQRDFPAKYIQGGNKVMHLREVLEKRINPYCQEMRHMEVRDDLTDVERARPVIYYYQAQGEREVFISFKSCDCHQKSRRCTAERERWWYGEDSRTSLSCGFETKIYGFLRLRLSNRAGKEAFPVLHNMGLIRELHVYGRVIPVYQKDPASGKKVRSQHYGFGKRMMAIAEKIAYCWGTYGTAVIAGVGVREYYRKLGYEIPEGEITHHGNMLIKRFEKGEKKKSV